MPWAMWLRWPEPTLSARWQWQGNQSTATKGKMDRDYDSVGNIVKEEHSDGSMAAYKYDADAMLIEAINETSHIKLIRDKTGRVIREEQDGYWVGKTYDSDGNCIRTVSSLGADISMQYDEWGMLIEMNGKCGTGIEAQPSSTAASLDAKLKENDARVARLTGAVNPDSQPQASQPAGWQALFQRDDSGLELYRQLSGGVSVQTECDRLGRVTRRAIGAKNVEQSRTRYDWGQGNKLNKIVNELTRTQANFEYDAFDNLVSATYDEKSGRETIYRVPDKIGNLFKTKDKSDRKYSKGGRLLEDDQYCYYYDAEGNLIFKEFKRNENLSAGDKTEIAKEKGIVLRRTATGWEYEWAGNGMLQKVINPGGAFDALIIKNAEVNVPDENRNPPLFYAVFNYLKDQPKYEHYKQSLLKAGADPDLENKHGVSPRSLADQIANSDVKKYFLNKKSVRFLNSHIKLK